MIEDKSKMEFSAAKIRFEIEALGPIRDSAVDFKPFLLFSGESNTGKSYAALAVYYLFYMLKNEKTISELTRKLLNIKKIESDLKTKEEIVLEISEGLTDEMGRLYDSNIARFMSYMLGYDNFSCKLRLKLKIPQISGSKIYISHLKGDNGIHGFRFKVRSNTMDRTTQPGILDNREITIEDDLKSVIGRLCREFIFDEEWLRNFFLPPARGTFSGLSPSMWKEISSIGMYNEFLKSIDSVRYSILDMDEKLEEQKKIIIPLFERILNGKISVERDREIYTLAGSGEKIPLTAGSSSVKELFPLYLLLNRVPIDELSICIEEPEAHLHPELQRSAAQLLSYIVNQGGFIQVATHSDFFVNQVNNLLKLHFIKNKTPNRFKKVLKETGIREEFVLDPEDVGAYYFEKIKDKVRTRKLEVSENGMTLDSFKGAYEQSVKETRILREALTADEE
jgi:predicted ATPase